MDHVQFLDAPIPSPKKSESIYLLITVYNRHVVAINHRLVGGLSLNHEGWKIEGCMFQTTHLASHEATSQPCQIRPPGFPTGPRPPPHLGIFEERRKQLNITPWESQQAMHL